MKATPLVSIVMATYNRREVVRHTLDQIADCGLGEGEYEVIAADNASTDGTPEVFAGRPHVRVLRLDENLGSCAKALAVEQARGELILFLDDDSYPRPGCLARMQAHFAADARLGAAGFTVHLADGRQECSALPHVFVGCGVGLRARALREVGGLDRSFFMQAEEYDLSLRLLQAGWRVEVLGDLQVEHGKSPVARRSERTTFYDVCNNLRVIGRYLPPAVARAYRHDWLRRYGWLAEQAGHGEAFAAGIAAGRQRMLADRRAGLRRQLLPDVLEDVFCWSRIEGRMRELRREGVRRIVLADMGKNVYAFWRGAQRAGLNVLAVADDRLAAPGRIYRDAAVMSSEAAEALGAEAWVVSNTSYVHARRRERELAAWVSVPVHNWFSPPTGAEVEAVGEVVTTGR
ncbi:MAG: glycosyltransferase [Phycisphaerae bacterium]|jgi:GT2 family glycosyltransferase